MEYEQLIKSQAAKAFHVDEKDVIIINRLLGGMSHLTYHIQIQDVDYTYRIIGKDGNLFVDREIEYQNLKIIEPLMLNNETVFFDVKTGEKAAKYVEGTVLTTIDFHPYLDDVAKTLKKLHQSEMKPASDYGLIQRLDLSNMFQKTPSSKY